MSQSPPSANREPCPACGVILDVEPEAVFALVRCPRCRAEVRVHAVVASYRLAEILGQGGSGCVFRARREGEDRDVALKVLGKNIPDYEEHLLLLRNEALMARLVDHHRVVKVLGLEVDDEGARLVMELMAGGSLHDLIAEGEPLGEERVLRLGLEILKALEAALSKGIIHRDLKPANILFNATRGAKLGDFGLARSAAAKPVDQSHLLATPDYVSPEILGGFQGDFLSDIYSLGGALFHALAGSPPYSTEGLSTEGLRALKADPVQLPPEVCSQSTRTLVARMMNPDPSGRFGSYGELEASLISTLGTMEGGGTAFQGAGQGRGAGLLRGFLPRWFTARKAGGRG